MRPTQLGGGLTPPGGATTTTKKAKGRRERPDSIQELKEAKVPPEELHRGKTEQERQHIKENWVSIRHYSHHCRVQSTYNIQYDGEADITPQLDAVFRAQPRAFKANASAGVLLRRSSTPYFERSPGRSKPPRPRACFCAKT